MGYNAVPTSYVYWFIIPYLVGGLEHECYFPFHIWNNPNLIDELIFFRGVAQPTRYSYLRIIKHSDLLELNVAPKRECDSENGDLGHSSLQRFPDHPESPLNPSVYPLGSPHGSCQMSQIPIGWLIEGLFILWTTGFYDDRFDRWYTSSRPRYLFLPKGHDCMEVLLAWLNGLV